MTQAASLYTSIVLESSSFIVPLRNIADEVEKSSRRMEQEQERLAKSADRLLSSVDPVYAAQSRFNKEMDKAKSLYSAGAISAEQFAMAESNLKARLEQATSALTTHNAVSAQSQQRMRNLGYQISDVGVQLAGGQSPFLILAQQGPQVAMAMEGAKGAVGRFASFLTGPWGAALLAGGSMVGMFASKMLESRNVTEEHERSSKTLRQAIEDLDRATGLYNQTLGTKIRLEEEETRKKYDDNIKARNKALEELEKAQARLATNEPGAAGWGKGLDMTSAAASGAKLEISSLQKQIADLNKDISDADGSFRRAGAALALQKIREELDPTAAAIGRFERAMEDLTNRRVKDQITEEQFAREAEALERKKKADLEAASAMEKAGQANGKAARDWEKASNSRIQALLTERAAMEQYVNDLKILEEAARSGTISAAERSLATIRARQEMLDGLGLEKIEPKIADFDADKVIKASMPKFDPKDLFEITPIREFANELERSAERAQRLDQMATQMASHMASSFEEAIFSGKGLRSVFNGLLEDMGKMVVRFTVLEPLARSFADALKGSGSVGSSIAPGEDNVFARLMKGVGSIFSVFGGARANGGPVTAGKTYLVGERGPELFSPGSSGNIIPNGALQGMGRVIEQHFHVNAQGAILAQGLIAEIQAVGMRAEARGSADAQVQMARRARRRLP